MLTGSRSFRLVRSESVRSMERLLMSLLRRPTPGEYVEDGRFSRACGPTAARVLKVLRAGGRQTTDQLTAALAEYGRAIRPATIQVALGELVAAELVASNGEDGQQRWRALP
ncbi:MAG TPA: hypothetical protein VL330_18835, partial [Actinomycetes bacterium]|nr:hypothetical protein [Actinomycetes bacterium]